jgi:hypothetical protein
VIEAEPNPAANYVTAVAKAINIEINRSSTCPGAD